MVQTLARVPKRKSVPPERYYRTIRNLLHVDLIEKANYRVNNPYLRSATVEIILKATDQIDLMDRRLLEKAQDEFPLTLRPWASIGNELGITEREVMKRLSALFRKGVIRKIGPALDAKRLGLRA